jgi:hypothetical protein
MSADTAAAPPARARRVPLLVYIGYDVLFET